MKNNAGNALWFVLLAIALLAALTVTISRSSDTTDQGNDFERRRVQVSDILRYSSNIATITEQMRIRGLSENDISFQNGTTAANYTNANCGDTGCLVFNAEGGGATYKNFPASINNGDWIFSGANDISSVGTTAPDLIMILPEVDQSICSHINTEMGIAGIPQDALKADIGNIYTGGFSNPGETISAAPGKRTACFQGFQDENGTDISAKFYFYQVLIAR